jgi:phenylpyruvate tautomerase PptA (4-oxalocrotonate tautomerase family)
MPVVRISYPRGALTPDRKRQLASSLTEIVLDAEVDAVTPPGRLVTVVHFQEVAADDWAVAGELRLTAAGAPDHFIVDVMVLEGLLDDARKSDVHRRVSEAFVKAFADDPNAAMVALRVWVLIHDVREGSWGAAGRTVSALDVAQFINPDLHASRRAEITALVGAHGPTGRQAQKSAIR